MQTTKLKCECGKEFAKQGQLNLHKYHCALKKAAEQAQKGGGKQPPERAQMKTCDHQFRLLNPRTPNEYNAMQHGYGEVCTKCQDLQ